jgi:hypothetical protein
MNEVNLHISTHPSKFAGYQAKAGSRGKITLYVSTLWEDARGDEDQFLEDLAYVYLLERVCLERAFQRIRMTDRCEPVCKLLRIADLMMYPDEWPLVRDHWTERRTEV